MKQPPRPIEADADCFSFLRWSWTKRKSEENPMPRNEGAGKTHHKILIIGGGTAGIVTAKLLVRAGEADVAVIEPSRLHYYQPLWTLVGAGVVGKEASIRSEARYIPRNVRWIEERAVEIAPDRQRVTLASGAQVGYDFLVVAAGAQLNWNAIPGLEEAIRRGDASSNYAVDLAPRTWELIRNFRGGVALFHMPGTPIKCPGAPQKIMYLAADYFRRNGLANQARVVYGSGTAAIYGVKEYAAVLDRVLERYRIDARFEHELVEIFPEKKEAIFRVKNGSASDRVTIPYDILHAAPPESAPDFIRQSSLADPQKPQEGWVQVDKHTLRHTTYANVFALGDVAGTPNAKTGAAACRQAPLVVANLLAVIAGQEPQARYDGYIACPIVTGYGRMVLCETDYTGKPAPQLPWIDTFRERYDMWLLKRYGLPWLYWNLLLRGRKPPLPKWGRYISQELQQEQPASR
jgi:sulfide:quinone oxidoreductase